MTLNKYGGWIEHIFERYVQIELLKIWSHLLEFFSIFLLQCIKIK